MSLNIDGVEKSTYRVFDFKGGLNKIYTNTALADNEATNLVDVDFTTRGAIKQRAGLNLTADFRLPKPQALLSFRFTEKGDVIAQHEVINLTGGSTSEFRVGSYKPIIKTRTRIKHEDDGNGNPVEDTFEYTPYTNTFTNDPVSFFSHSGKIFFVHPQNGGFMFDGTVENNTYVIYHIPTIPKGRFALVKNQRVFITGNPDNPNFVYFSVVGDPENFDISVDLGGDVVTTTGAGGLIRTEDDDTYITGIAEFNSRLIIFKTNYIYSVTGVDAEDDRLEPLNVASGCIDGYSIAKSDNQLFYLANDGVRAIRNVQDTVVESIPLSDKIFPRKMGSAGNGQWRVVAMTQGSRYFISGLSFDGTYVFDEILGAWTFYSCSYRSVAYYPQQDIMCMGGDDGNIRYFLEGRLNDEIKSGVFQAIPATYSSPLLTLGEPEVTKRFRSLKVFYKPNPVKDSKIDVKIEVDYKENWKNLPSSYTAFEWDSELWDEASWDVDKEEISGSVRFSGTGNTVRVSFTNDKLDEALSIHGYVLIYKRKRKVR